MKGNCTFILGEMPPIPIDSIIRDAPKGKVPMFLVTSINDGASGYAYDLHGEYVYVKDGVIIDPITGMQATDIEPENLHFCRYIDTPTQGVEL